VPKKAKTMNIDRGKRFKKKKRASIRKKFVDRTKKLNCKIKKYKKSNNFKNKNSSMSSSLLKRKTLRHKKG